MNDEVEEEVHHTEEDNEDGDHDHVHEAVDVNEEDDSDELGDGAAGELEEGETVLVLLDGDAGSPREFSSVDEAEAFLDEVERENLDAESD